MLLSNVAFWMGVLQTVTTNAAPTSSSKSSSSSSLNVKRASASYSSTPSVRGVNSPQPTTNTTTGSSGTALTSTNITAVKAGNYNILFCGNQTTALRESLQLLWSNLGSLKQDIQSGTKSQAYQAFFKSNTYTSFVDEMLTNITTGAALQKSGQSEAEAPTLACLTGPGIATGDTDQGPRDLYTICSENSYTNPVPKYAAFYRSSTNWIFLCPAFFTAYAQQTVDASSSSSSSLSSPPSISSSSPSQYCPNVVDNYFVQSYWMHLVQNQMYLLMHEILHFYLDSAPYPSQNPSSEATDINVMFNFAASDAISNPESYVIYAAMVSAGCQNYPAATDNDPDECAGTCLSKLGSTAGDIVQISNMTMYGVTVDEMSVSSLNSTISGGTAAA